MKSFKISKYITLLLKDGKTEIYVNNELFLHCKKLILQLDDSNFEDFDDIESVDELVGRDSFVSDELIDIPPEVEFWGHCSNLQVWFENDYDTSLLHSNLAFPLLKKLSEVGDPLAKKVFKEEILKKLETGANNVILYLLENYYLDHFTEQELRFVYENIISKFKSSGQILPFLKALFFQNVPIAHKHYKNLVINLLLTENYIERKKIIGAHIGVLSREDMFSLFNRFKSIEAIDGEKGDRFSVLESLMTGTNFTFETPDIISTLLYENEREYISEIFTISKFPYVKFDFEADEVRRRVWEKKLYYEFFEGHVVSIELLCNTSNKDIFYRNLKGLKEFYKLEQITLLFFCDYDYYKVEDLLLALDLVSIKKIKIYEFTPDIHNPILRSLF